MRDWCVRGKAQQGSPPLDSYWAQGPAEKYEQFADGEEGSLGKSRAFAPALLEVVEGSPIRITSVET